MKESDKKPDLHSETVLNNVFDTNPQKQGKKKRFNFYISIHAYIERDIFFASQTKLKATDRKHISIQKRQQYIFATNL